VTTQETTMKVAVEGKGDIVIKLYTKEAPKACNHIMALIKQGFYDGQRFFRVTRSPRPYIAQAGDPASRNGVDDPTIGSGGTGARIPYEDSGHSNVKYAVGLAAVLSKDRDSGDSQFYIVLGDGNKFLDGSYTVFGMVTSGQDVVDKLEKGDKITSVTIGS
jgi:peptidyl-prolyl cis-trans isomerase B (cyclophilin B)